MTVLDLGPEFKNISSANSDFASNLGKSGCVIYCNDAIYSNQHEFKLNSTSTTTIAYDRGIINPSYRPIQQHQHGMEVLVEEHIHHQPKHMH